jgi:Raf kinase inhibitor-like YbhB/YbcL family protein
MKLTSTAFAHHGAIPALYTCEGRDVSPPLAWSDVPAGAKSLALVCFDPDAPDPAAPKMTWVHWVLYDIAPTANGIAEGEAIPHGAHSGLNDWNRTGYGGPCPPVGRHRYFFELYALDTRLPDLRQPTRAQLMNAIKGHALANAELVGTYQKRRH